MTKGVYYGGGRNKLNLSDEEWKFRRKEQRKTRQKKEELENWKYIVSKIVVDYVEGESIKDIVQEMYESGTKVSKVFPEYDVVTLVPQKVELGLTKENCYCYEKMPQDNDLLPTKISKWFAIEDLDDFVLLDIDGTKTIRRAVKAIAMGIINNKDPFKISGFNDILTNTLKLSKPQAKEVKKILVERNFLIEG